MLDNPVESIETMKIPLFLIQLGPDKEFYLDGFDGSVFEFIPDRDKAWHMTAVECALRLKRVQSFFPDALMIEA